MPRSPPQLPAVLAISCLTVACCLAAGAGALEVGVGVADITGPAGEVPMMGYAETSQKTAGIHLRLYSRAFAFRDQAGNSAAYVVVDSGMISQMLRLRVAELLQQRLGSVYTVDNVMLSATHTHSGPGGFHGYTMYAIATLGYYGKTFHTFADGIAQSIVSAHSSLRPAKLLYNAGQVQHSGVNRSPTSYQLNPESERRRYGDNVDRKMELLKIVDARTGRPFAALNWHAVHPTSMNNTNHMISGDNKGWAAQLFERTMEAGATLPGRHSFVAAFANANEGDVSPNTLGPRCIDTGEPCDILTSACGNSAKKCIAFGPGRDMIDSTRIIAQRQFAVAKSLFDSADQELQVDTVGYRHQSVDMSNYEVSVAGQRVRTCEPAMGFSFAAGTTDGPGGFDFTQGDVSGNPLWNAVRNILSKPSQQQVSCQHPKPILLNTGPMTFPTQWQPRIVETQLLRIGPLVLVGLPGEFTTMAGRRVREAVSQTLASNGMRGAKVILSGLSNLYASYVATFEEYQAQRYEAASTMYGPHTLSAYAQQFSKLAKSLATGGHLVGGVQPPNLYGSIRRWSFITPIVYDSVGTGRNFGDVVRQPEQQYTAGGAVRAVFRTGHPRNNMLLGQTFLLVQRRTANGGWEDVCNDACVETRFQWVRTNSVLGRSEAHMQWDIPECVRPGTYRLQHIGYYKPMIGSTRRFTGVTREFSVVGSVLRSWLRRRYSVDVLNASIGCGCV